MGSLRRLDVINGSETDPCLFLLPKFENGKRVSQKWPKDGTEGVMTASQPEPRYFEVGVSRGIPCKLCYELHGEGDIKILFIMGGYLLVP